MSFTRSFLKANGLNDDQITSVMEEHVSVVDQLKSQRDAFKADAEKLPQVQQELDALKNGEDFKAKYDKEHADFEQYKADIAKAAEEEKVKTAYRKLLQAENIGEKHLDSILGVTRFDGMKLDKDGNLEGVDALRKTIADRYGDFVVKTSTKVHQPDTPPTNDNGGEGNVIRQMAAKWHDQRYGKSTTNQT